LVDQSKNIRELRKLSYFLVKRTMDIILSLVGLIILSPFFLILVIAIKVDSKGPVLFKQKRIGKGKSYFNILKFRTMRIDTPKDTPTHLLLDPEQYITRVGKFLRKTSLDEIPQIWNIFIGEMSIIGPRPALWNQYDLILERDKYGANDVLPGLTGWAQINGRDVLSIETKARFDGEYVQKMSLGFDFRCFWGTIICVLKSEGVIEGGIKEKNAAIDLVKNDRYDSDKQKKGM
jgi:O-antigen biosynthesis protein WbqP